MISKSRIDRAGTILSDPNREYDELALELDYIFEDYRKQHLRPLTQTTLKLQEWLQSFDKNYYIAQRLKRRPQILRKLRRLSVRLTQLQDIGGCRVIVDSNEDVDSLADFISERIVKTGTAKLLRVTDYRELGRDDSGYRALHFLLEVDGFKIELQLRSRIQHYWSESIERTSVIYGRRLKEGDGDPVVIQYFKAFSDILHSIETQGGVGAEAEIVLQQKRELAEATISQSTHSAALGGHVNSDIVRTMAEQQKQHSGGINNWILIFDWSDGNFVHWDIVDRDPEEATNTYSRYERDFPEEEKFEVVMIGSSDIATVQHTHSHYFGIEHHSKALEGMETSIIGLSKRSELDVGARRILFTLKRRKYWGKNQIKVATLKNHYCQSVATFDESLKLLLKMGLLEGSDPISLNIKRSEVINSFA